MFTKPVILHSAFALVWVVAAFAQPARGANKSNVRPTIEKGSGSAAQPVVPPGYRIGAGDVIQVDVWKEPDASVKSVVVRSDGKISLPLIKEVEVIGLTPTEVEKLVSDKLTQYIHKADVTVVVQEVRSKKVYLVGAVKREGPVPLHYQMSILQVLSEAGGLTDYAKRKKIYVLRSENGKQIRIPFDYTQVIKGEHMEQNITVLPDDTIVVPQ